MTRIKTAAVTTALAGALSLVALAGASAADLQGFEKCYGVSKAGQNSCAGASGSHSCAGQSAKDYDGQEWRAVKAGVCKELGGKTEAFNGTGTPKDMSKKG